MSSTLAGIAILCLILPALGAAPAIADQLVQEAYTITSAPVEARSAGSLSDSGSRYLDRASSVSVFESDGSLYAAVTSFGEGGFQLVNIADSDNPRPAGKLQDSGSLELRGAYGAEIFEAAGFLYAAVVSSGDDGLQLINITDPYNPRPAGNLQNSNSALLDAANGVAVFETGGSVYAAVASSDSDALQIVDITDPDNPVPAGNLQRTTPNQLALNGARGVDTFQIDSKTYAVVAAFQSDGIQIVDITDPDNPSAAGKLLDSSSRLLDGARDVDIFKIGGSTFAAIAADGRNEDGLQLVDVTNPASPAAIGHLKDDGSLLLEGASRVDVFETGGGAYAAVTAINDVGIQLVDVTDPANPVPVGQTKGKTRLFGDFGAVTVYEAGGALHAASAGASGADASLDLTRLMPSVLFDNPVPVGRLQDGNSVDLDSPRSIDIFTIGSSSYAAVAVYSDDSLQIVNITDPANPAPAGKIRDNGSRELDGAHGVDTFKIGLKTYAAVASEQDDGFQIVDVSNPASPSAVGYLEDTDSLALFSPRGVDTFQIGPKAYAAVTAWHDNGLQLVDISNPASPAAEGMLQSSNTVKLDQALGVDTFQIGSKTYAAVAAHGSDAVQIVDISDPANPAGAGHISDDGRRLLDGSRGVSVFGIGSATYAAAASLRDNGLGIIDVDIPTLRYFGGLGDGDSRLLGNAYDLDVFRAGGSTYAAVTAWSDDGLQIVNLANPASPSDAGKLRDSNSLELDGAISAAVFVAGYNTYAIVAADIDDGLQIVKLTTTDLIKPVFVSATLDENTGVLTITFDETIDVSGVDLTKLYVSETGQSNEVSVNGAAFDRGASDSNTISMTLTQAQLNLIIPMDAPQLDISAGAVSDLAANSIDAASNNAIDLVLDITMPSFVLASLNKNTGAMSVAFDEVIDVSGVDLTKLYVSETGQSNEVSVNGAAFDRGASDLNTISVTLTQAQLNLIIPMDAPQLDIVAGAVSDLAGNAISDEPDLDILLLAAGTDTVLWNATITSEHDPDEGQRGWLRSGLGDIVHHTPTGNAFVLEGRTHTITAVLDSLQSSQYQLYINPAIPQQDRDSVHLVMGDLRCSFAAAEGSGRSPYWDYVEPTDTFHRAETPAAIIYNSDYLTLNGDATVTIAKGEQYVDAGVSTPDGADIASNAGDVDPSLGGTYKIKYTASKGCGIQDTLDTATRTVTVLDTAGPSLEFAALNENTGEMTIAFDEAIDISAANLTALHVGDAGQTNPISLQGAGFNSTAPDSDTMFLSLNQEQLSRIFQMSEPQLDIEDGAIEDLFGNAIGAKAGSPIDTTFHVSKQALLGEPGAFGSLEDDGSGGSLLLGGAHGVDTFEIGQRTYAAVAALGDGGLQLVDITDPANLRPAGKLKDTKGQNELLLEGAIHVNVFEIGKRTYAAVTSIDDHGLQLVDITNPDNPRPAGSLPDTGSLLLGGSRNVDTFEIGQRTYAAVAAVIDNGLQLVDVTDPDNPRPTGKLEDTEGQNELLLHGAIGVDTFVIGQNTYAAVASSVESSLQLVDITNPASPAAAGQLRNANDLLLASAVHVDTFVIGQNTYAAVASHSGDALQLVDVTDPDNPRPAGKLNGTQGQDKLYLDGARGMDIFEAGQSTYAAIVSDTDDALQLVDVTDPANPRPAGNLPDAGSLLLDEAYGVDTFVMGSSTYAAIASELDDGLQIVHLASVPDGDGPAFESAELNRKSGEMTIKFDEPVNFSAVDLAKMHASDAGQTNGVSLGGAEFDRAAPDSYEISLKLNQTQLGLIIAMDTPQLDIEAGAVEDLFGNAIAAASGLPILTFDVGSDNVLWNATVISEYNFDEGVTGWYPRYSTGSIAHNPPTASNSFDFNGTTYTANGLYYSANTGFTAARFSGKLIPESERDSLYIAIDDKRCSFSTAGIEGGGNPYHAWYNRFLSNPYRAGTNSTVAILYNENYLTLNGSDTVIIPVGSQYREAGYTTPEETSVTSNATGIDTSVSGTHKIQYKATKGCGTLDTAVRTVEVVDDAKPAFASAELNRISGEMTIRFDKKIDASAANLALMYASDAGQTNEVSLGGAEFDRAAPDSYEISLKLNQTQLGLIIAMSTPQLDIEAGAVQDLFGNAIAAAPDNSILTFAASSDIVLWNATVISEYNFDEGVTGWYPRYSTGSIAHNPPTASNSFDFNGTTYTANGLYYGQNSRPVMAKIHNSLLFH